MPLARATAKSGRSDAHCAKNRGSSLHPEATDQHNQYSYAGVYVLQRPLNLWLESDGKVAEKIAAVFKFGTSPLFTDAERAALHVAWHGALQLNAIMDKDFEALKAHFLDREMV